jgi:hypothetical protein
MSIERRLHRLESALPASIAVRHWLAEAHSHGSAGAYGAWLAEQPPEASPRRRLRAQASSVARAALPAGSVEGSLAADQARRDAIFLVELVVTLNERIEAVLEPGFLRAETLDAELRLLGLEARTGVSAAIVPTGGPSSDGWLSWCLDYAAWANVLVVADAARTALEDRYLGMPALFPDLAADWASLLARVDDLAGLAAAGPQTPEADQPWTWPPERRGLVLLTPAARRSSARAHAAITAADLLDVAVGRAFRSLGDPEKAQAAQARRINRLMR